jgi:hypothetical protein
MQNMHSGYTVLGNIRIFRNNLYDFLSQPILT